MGRRRFRRRHQLLAQRRRPPRKRPPTATERLLAWGTAALLAIFIFWFVDTRSGLLRPHRSPLLALLIDVGVLAVVALGVALRKARR